MTTTGYSKWFKSKKQTENYIKGLGLQPTGTGRVLDGEGKMTRHIYGQHTKYSWFVTIAK